MPYPKIPALGRPLIGLCLCWLLSWGLDSNHVTADEPQKPHGQDTVPGPALSPAEAIAKMTVPPGFSVEVVASEPDLVNPVAMTIDERGRFWVTESLEYPRREPGAGKDRVKILEDTDADGKVDKTTIFAEGLNIPSGVAVGHGGVWVANAPDLLFMQDTNGDDKADKVEVIVTGFGRDDTHELPNSLTWGPDGWLYGINGVFNNSHIHYPEGSPHHKADHPGWKFTCAIFRVHPRTREFQVWCEGTSNPWGIAWDNHGSLFISACVIDHLWHLTESGYYQRQGGPYPPFTWAMRSIVDHKHQKAAYCGIHYFDSDAYPEQYREKLYMGNIHGNCLNSDHIEQRGSTYFGTPLPDFLSANDAWFMPVVQKTGPDGCLYVLDWYDRYHCYQDANRDPGGIDRLRGRLYRIRYEQTPRAGVFDLSRDSDEQLIARLQSPNVYYRDIAQRILSERQSKTALPILEKLVQDEKLPGKYRMHALWAILGAGQLSEQMLDYLLRQDNPALRAWGVRAAGDQGEVSAAALAIITELAQKSPPEVLIQVAIAAKKLKGANPIKLLFDVLVSAEEDEHLQQIVWHNLHPLLGKNSKEFMALVKTRDLKTTPGLKKLMPRVTERILAGSK
ncbi:MAG: hypothetical protein SFX18_06425 [Pirellulales bacterium]|nr:hypothetical protein [Pirellulales bacterium]